MPALPVAETAPLPGAAGDALDVAVNFSCTHPTGCSAALQLRAADDSASFVGEYQSLYGEPFYLGTNDHNVRSPTRPRYPFDEAKRTEPYRPHLALLYGELEASKLASLAAAVTVRVCMRNHLS